LKKLCLKRTGYLSVGLSVAAKRHECLVHQLVAEAFLGPCPTGKEVNHKDGIKIHNAAKNLEYVTRVENSAHARRMGLHCVAGTHNPKAKLTEAKVAAIIAENENGASTKALSEKYEVWPSTIRRIVTGKLWRRL
jgi:hypothetical protein